MNAPIRSTLALTTVLVAACAPSHAEQAQRTPAAAVEVATVELRNASPRITATGMVGGKEEVALSFKIGGVIARIATDAGQRVRAGDVIAELASTEIGSEVEKARQARDKGERDVARVRALYHDSVATLEQLENATTGLEVARANVRIAEFNQQHAEIRAPSDGVVLRRTAEASQLVAPGMPILVMRTDRKGLVLRVGLADRDVVRVRTGDAATIRFDAYPTQTFGGRVTQIASAASPATGTYEVEIAIADGGRALASGLIGHVELAPRATASFPTIPIEALVEADDDSAAVFVLENNGRTAARRRVRLAFIDGARAVIRDGLTPTDRVITAGAAYVADGAPVNVVRTLTTSAGRVGR